MPETADDVELLESVLVGYIADVRRAPGGDAWPQVRQSATPVDAAARPGKDDDLRGRFVLMNEDSGEIIGALNRSVRT